MASISITSIGGRYTDFNLRVLLEKLLAEEAKDIKREFEITVRTWKRKPIFTLRKTFQGFEVFTSDEIYGYVDEGTRPHVIAARRAKTLRFNTKGFRSKTVVGRLNPRAGAVAKPPTAYPIAVQHPGMEGRGFTELVSERSQKRFSKRVRVEIARALARMGKRA